ncbi:MAG: ATP-binding cassette domain-containing protein [Bacteroidaceae bacterium]|nr:ATP-binding cassette domain-containing protein [Bacteroidaceae bacterium]MBQ8455641.1 ATP-binding cassette domain-containing protein [Bacteroidaceae bacterium]MBQ9170329.1 ATP-binding cassette domain-containing protein [Bacteroidaceae bacterium]MBQ9294472.1 ATP-binding cassette domain-containing protein [Bacteroidaceae bacterium]
MILNYKDIDIFQDEHLVLSDVNFCVEEGEMVYLTGQVGSGKSSLLKTIYGELPVEKGQAEVLGFNMSHLKTKHQPALRRQMGIVFQDFQLLRDRTVHRNLDFVLRSTGWKKQAEREQRIVEVLEMVKLADKKDKFIYELSGGEQQRICIARAILNNPKVILADEPTGNLDAENGELILALLDEIRRQNHTAVIISTHNLQWPEYFPGTVYRCDEAKLIKEN